MNLFSVSVLALNLAHSLCDGLVLGAQVLGLENLGICSMIVSRDIVITERTVCTDPGKS